MTAHSVEPHHPHDKGYKQLLSNKSTFLELIRTFVREKWVETIDEGDLVLVDKSYILQDFSEKEADIVYRLKTSDKSVIFYILLELQSTVDHLMPLRLLLYMVEIWREIYNNTPEKERERKDFRLPAVIPAVLYNGAPRWTPVLNFKEMLAGYREFEKHVLDFRYLLFDVNRYSEEELYSAANVISSVFVLDQKMEQAELVRRLRTLAAVLKDMTPDSFRQVLVWLKNVINPQIGASLHGEVERILDESKPWEVEKMISNLEVTLEEMQKQALLKGKTENKFEVARAALKKGLSVEDIRDITGLSEEEILKLKEKLN